MADEEQGAEVVDAELLETHSRSQRRAITIQSKSETWQFELPLPPPAVLAQYEELIPHFADRFMTNWEGQTQHRQHLERVVVEGGTTAQARGQHYALVLGGLVVVAAATLGVTGHDLAAVTMVGFDFVGLGGVFVFSKVHDARELRKKETSTPAIEPSRPPRTPPKGQPTPARTSNTPKKKGKRR